MKSQAGVLIKYLIYGDLSRFCYEHNCNKRTVYSMAGKETVEEMTIKERMIYSDFVALGTKRMNEMAEAASQAEESINKLAKVINGNEDNNVCKPDCGGAGHDDRQGCGESDCEDGANDPRGAAAGELHGEAGSGVSASVAVVYPELDNGESDTVQQGRKQGADKARNARRNGKSKKLLTTKN